MRKILSGASALGLALVVAAPAFGQVQPGFGPRFGPGEVPLPGDLSPGLGQPAQPAPPPGVTGQVDPTVPGLDDGAPGLAPGRLPGIQPLPRPGAGLGLPAPGQAAPGMPGGPPPATLGGPGFGMPNDPALGGAQDPTLGGIAPGLAPRPRPAAAEEPEPEEGPDDPAEPDAEAGLPEPAADPTAEADLPEPAADAAAEGGLREPAADPAAEAGLPDPAADPTAEAGLPEPAADPAAPAAAADESALDAAAPEAPAAPGEPTGLSPETDAAGAAMPDAVAPSAPGTAATDETAADEPMQDAADTPGAEMPAGAAGAEDRFATLEALDAVLVAAGADQVAPFLGEARPVPEGEDGSPSLVLLGAAAEPEAEDDRVPAGTAMPDPVGAADVAVLQGLVEGNPVYAFPLPLPAAAPGAEAGPGPVDTAGMDEADLSAVRVSRDGRTVLLVLVPIGDEEEPALTATDLAERLEAEGLGEVEPLDEGLVLRRGEHEGRPVLAFAGAALGDQGGMPE
jgi:hypothetical protein